MEANQVLEFLDVYGTEVNENETGSYVELMMDNHKCVEYQEKQYYIPEDTYYENDEEEVYYYLVENHLL